MACNGCNDGCFDESIQSTQGPQGATGQSAYELAVEEGFVGTESQWIASLNGEDGVDGVAVIQANMSATSTTSNSYASGAIQSDTINGTTIDFGTVDDVLKLKFGIIGDSTSVSTTNYDWKVEYGSDTIIDSSSATLFRLNSDNALAMNGCEVELDLVVTATDTIVPVLRFFRSVGIRTSKLLLSTTSINGSSLFTYVLPAVSISSPISGNNALKLSVKNGDNSSTVDIVHYELIKYLK